MEGLFSRFVVPSLTVTGAFEDYGTSIEVSSEVSFKSGPCKVFKRMWVSGGGERRL